MSLAGTHFFIFHHFQHFFSRNFRNFSTTFDRFYTFFTHFAIVLTSLNFVLISPNFSYNLKPIKWLRLKKIPLISKNGSN
jgi:hypothetical protein